MAKRTPIVETVETIAQAPPAAATVPKSPAIASERRGADGLLELVLEAHAERQQEQAALAAEPIEGVLVGRLVALSEGVPLVDFAGARAATRARAAAVLAPEDVGREVALMFEQADPTRPIILGLMQLSKRKQRAREASLDRERLVFEADREIELRCGKASIRLDKSGKVTIRGEHLLSRANVTNELQGGTVEIN